MAEETQSEEETEVGEELSHAEKTRPVLGKQDFVLLCSGVRKRHTRAKRMRSAMAYRARLVQRIGGDIVVRRNRPARVLEAQFKRHYETILEKVRAGLLEVRTSDNRLVDVESMRIIEPQREPAPQKPEPVRAEDMPAGRPIPITPEGTAQTEHVDPPKVTQPSIPEGQEPIETTEETADTQPSPESEEQKASSTEDLDEPSE